MGEDGGFWSEYVATLTSLPWNETRTSLPWNDWLELFPVPLATLISQIRYLAQKERRDLVLSMSQLLRPNTVL